MCLSCRINAQRAWTARILLEAMAWPRSLFVTLTYAPEHCPHLADGQQTLYPDDLTRFWKRLRKRLGGSRLRYFACGEYGEESWRPHYHAVIFNLSALDCAKVGRHMVHPDVQAAWGLGYTSAGDLSPERAAYCAQYVTKKMTRSTDGYVARQLAGRWPEFMRASRRPGIGALHVERMAEALVYACPEAEDVPTEIVMPDGRRFGMPTFIAHKLREELGLPRLASDRPPRPTEPPSGEYVEVVSHGLAGTVTRRVPIEEQRAREAEARALRKRKRRKEGLKHGEEEAKAFEERGQSRRRRGGGDEGSRSASSAGRPGDVAPSAPRRCVSGPPAGEGPSRKVSTEAGARRRDSAGAPSASASSRFAGAAGDDRRDGNGGGTAHRAPHA